MHSSWLPLHHHGPSSDGHHPGCYSSQDLSLQMLQMWHLWPSGRWVSFPQAASLEMAEMMKKGIWARQTAKSGPSKSTSLIQTDRWFHNGREGCNNSQQDKCTFPHCKFAHIFTAISRSTLLPIVVLVVQSPLHLNNFCKYLSNHPDQAWCIKLLKGIKCGVNIGFEGERTNIISDNWKSALDHSEVITGYLANEGAAGHKADPFTQPPFSDFVGLPMGIVAKKCLFPVKYRAIHDLFWPPEYSVNNHIDPDAFRCFYGSFDGMVALIVKHGLGAMSAKLDLAGAFKHILVRSQDWASWAHLRTSSSQMDLWSASTMWTSFFPLSCAALQLCSMNMPMPFNMPCKSTKCRTCYTTWMITLLFVHQTPQFVTATSQPWLLHARSLALLSILKKSQNLLQPQISSG